MTAKLILRDKEFEVQDGTTILYALVKLGIDLTVVRPMREGELIAFQEQLRDGDAVKFVPLVSGG